ncbi:Maf family protein [Aquariibacter albus]|uniref:7-methyl-GTP pyrophosphatase n=1 Tax=Aquariibacter albus TaxID=2759899 RepID=A0A839HK23_9BURK|nr:nucleoside triphosphate pyrophosphatase [Aquariibacter albus]MBB1162403.1 septum formation protein Maf [Aquariibacter albus]
MTAAPLILGSSSRYRAELLARLHLPFTCVAPEVDESPRPGESPQALAERLARSKALEVARRHPDAWVIGADQVADLAGEALGKPGDAAGARAQLQRLSGRSVVFHSALALVGPGGLQGEHCIPVRVRFRRLDEAAIARYIAREPAFDCAGSAKCEGLGIALLEAIESEDPTALIGLPLIATAALLRGVGLDPLGAAA